MSKHFIYTPHLRSASRGTLYYSILQMRTWASKEKATFPRKLIEIKWSPWVPMASMLLLRVWTWLPSRALGSHPYKTTLSYIKKNEGLKSMVYAKAFWQLWKDQQMGRNSYYLKSNLSRQAHSEIVEKCGSKKFSHSCQANDTPSQITNSNKVS